jgi:hypothetical protein
VKEPLLPGVVANEPETSVPDKSLDTAARHPSLPGLLPYARRHEYQVSFHRVHWQIPSVLAVRGS